MHSHREPVGVCTAHTVVLAHRWNRIQPVPCPERSSEPPSTIGRPRERSRAGSSWLEATIRKGGGASVQLPPPTLPSPPPPPLRGKKVSIVWEKHVRWSRFRAGGVLAEAPWRPSLCKLTFIRVTWLLQICGFESRGIKKKKVTTTTSSSWESQRFSPFSPPVRDHAPILALYPSRVENYCQAESGRFDWIIKTVTKQWFVLHVRVVVLTRHPAWGNNAASKSTTFNIMFTYGHKFPPYLCRVLGPRSGPHRAASGLNTWIQNARF